MFKSPKFYTSTIYFILLFYLILMPTKNRTLKMEVSISWFFSWCCKFCQTHLRQLIGAYPLKIDLKLITATINRMDQCVPWSVFTRQLDSQHPYMGLCIDACCLLTGRGQGRHWKLWVLSFPYVTPTGQTMYQCKEVCLNISIIQLIVLRYSLLNTLAVAIAPL